MKRAYLVVALCVLAGSGCAPQTLDAYSTQQASPAVVAAESTSAPTPAASPSPEPAPPAATETTQMPDALLRPGDSGDHVRDLQHRLLQIGWYSGKITGEFDEVTVAAVNGFQEKRSFEPLGYVDQLTWDLLSEMTRQPSYEEMNNILVAGPALLKEGDSGDQVKDLQARLKQIAWYDKLIDGSYGSATVEAVRGFQAKREIPVTGEVDQRTLDRLHAMTRQPTDDELNNRSPKPSGQMSLDPRCLSGRVLCVSKAQRKLAWVIDGQIQLTLDVRFGSSQTPTRNGEFSVGWKSRDHVSTIYHTAMPYAMFFSGGQAIHYSADFASNGYNGASHGCVNVRDKDAIAALFEEVKVGDKVIVYTG